MTDWQERVYHELHDLNSRRDKLSRFIDSPAFLQLATEDMDLMTEQLTVMRQYADVLMRRIARFRR